WDMEKTAVLFSLKGQFNIVFALAFTPDGKQLTTVSGDGTARLWDLQSKTETYLLGKSTLFSLTAPRAATFSSDGMRSVTLSLDSTVRYWDLEKKKGPIL